MSKDTSKKKIIIIGGGIAGLSAGIYGQKCGFDTEIYEKNPNVGGLCTSWYRKDIKIDGCIHWLTGTREGHNINKMWKHVNAFDQEDIIRGDNFGTVEYNGKKITFWFDLDKLEKELVEISPKDKRIIHKLRKMVEKFTKMQLPVEQPLKTLNIFQFMKIGIKMIPYMPAFLYAKKISQRDFAKKFKSKELVYILSRIVPGDGNLYSALYAFATNVAGNGGVPKGGSTYIIERMEKEYLANGGTIHLNSEVEEFVMKRHEVEGIKLKNGEVKTADYFVTSCDAYEVIRRFLKKDPRHRDVHLLKRFTHPLKFPAPSCVYVSFKVKADVINSLGLTSTYEFSCEPYHVGKLIEESVKMRNYSYDPSFINKDGYVLMNVLIHQSDKDFYYWEKLKKSYPLYLKEKQRVADDVKDRIEEHFPSLKGELEVIDVCTPMTYQRYVNAYRGAYMSWSFTERGRQLMHSSSIKGINNLIFSGQWIIMPGGIPIALMSGKFAIQLLLKKEHKSVVVSKYMNVKEEGNNVK